MAAPGHKLLTRMVRTMLNVCFYPLHIMLKILLAAQRHTKTRQPRQFCAFSHARMMHQRHHSGLVTPCERQSRRKPTRCAPCVPRRHDVNLPTHTHKHTVSNNQAPSIHACSSNISGYCADSLSGKRISGLLETTTSRLGSGNPLLSTMANAAMMRA